MTGPLIECDRCHELVPVINETWLGEALCPSCEAEQDNRRKATQEAETDAMEEEQEARDCADLEESGVW